VGETGTPKLFIKVKVSRDAMTTHLRSNGNAKGGHDCVLCSLYIAHERLRDAAQLSDETGGDGYPTCAHAEGYVKRTEGDISDRGVAKCVLKHSSEGTSYSNEIL
jgi:hypothetical protein